MRNEADDLGRAGAARRVYLRMTGLGALGVGAAALTPSWATATSTGARSAGGPTAKNTHPGKLSSNENPWGPSPKAIEAMQREVAFVNRYADKKALEFTKRIADIEGVDPEQVVVSNGSTPILRAFGEYVAQGGRGQVVTSMATYEVVSSR